MANTSIPLTSVVENTKKVSAPTAIVAANNHVVVNPVKSRNLLLVLTNTFAGAKVFTIKAATAASNPPAFRRELGDATLSLAQNEVAYFTAESARFRNADGTIIITVAASTTGTIEAVVLPVDAS